MQARQDRRTGGTCHGRGGTATAGRDLLVAARPGGRDLCLASYESGQTRPTYRCSPTAPACGRHHGDGGAIDLTSDDAITAPRPTLLLCSRFAWHGVEEQRTRRHLRRRDQSGRGVVPANGDGRGASGAGGRWPGVCVAWSGSPERPPCRSRTATATTSDSARKHYHRVSSSHCLIRATGRHIKGAPFQKHIGSMHSSSSHPVGFLCYFNLHELYTSTSSP